MKHLIQHLGSRQQQSLHGKIIQELNQHKKKRCNNTGVKTLKKKSSKNQDSVYVSL